MNEMEFDTVRRAAGRGLWMRRLGWIFLIAFLLRLGVAGILVAHNQLSWGVNEPSGIARAIVQGRGFSSAFHDAPGPTAWFAPAYPALLSCIFRVFGVETRASAIVAILLTVNFRFPDGVGAGFCAA